MQILAKLFKFNQIFRCLLWDFKKRGKRKEKKDTVTSSLELGIKRIKGKKKERKREWGPLYLIERINNEIILIIKERLEYGKKK